MKTISSMSAIIGGVGLVPCHCIKDVLGTITLTLPTDKGKSTTVFEQGLVRAQLYEALRYGFRSLSHLVSYEALAGSSQWSWSGVTLYYANYYAALSMNRLAGRSVSTLLAGGHYELTSGTVVGSFDVKRINVNNHELVWSSNYKAYSDFNWHDAHYDGTIVKVTSSPFEHFERKAREVLNYHPESYSEIFSSSSMPSSREFRRYYADKPYTVWNLPLSGVEHQLAILESSAVARQDIVFALFADIYKRLQPESQLIMSGYATQFLKRVAGQAPFSVKMKPVLNDFLRPLTIK